MMSSIIIAWSLELGA